MCVHMLQFHNLEAPPVTTPFTQLPRAAPHQSLPGRLEAPLLGCCEWLAAAGPVVPTSAVATNGWEWSRVAHHSQPVQRNWYKQSLTNHSSYSKHKNQIANQPLAGDWLLILTASFKIKSPTIQTISKNDRNPPTNQREIAAPANSPTISSQGGQQWQQPLEPTPPLGGSGDIPGDLLRFPQRGTRESPGYPKRRAKGHRAVHGHTITAVINHDWW